MYERPYNKNVYGLWAQPSKLQHAEKRGRGGGGGERGAPHVHVHIKAMRPKLCREHEQLSYFVEKPGAQRFFHPVIAALRQVVLQ